MNQNSRLQQTFSDLVSIDSPSFGERAMCDELSRRLRRLGLFVQEDKIAPVLGGNAGNLHGLLPATGGLEELSPLLFSCHMDTVEPSRGKTAIFHKDGTITSNGSTVLGADDVTGISAILEALERIQEQRLPHRALEVIFCPAEETYGLGSALLDYSTVLSPEAYVLDLSGPVGGATGKAPTILSFTATLHGRTSHAGFHPELGIHAIEAAVKAAARLKNGWHDENTMLNLGTITGGIQPNVIPDLCSVRGEIRSYCHEEALRTVEETRSIFAEEAERIGAVLDFSYKVHVVAFETAPEHRLVRRLMSCDEKLGLPFRYAPTMGASDGNVFRLNGVDCIVLSTFMENAHTCAEYTSVQALEQLAELVLELMTDTKY